MYVCMCMYSVYVCMYACVCIVCMYVCMHVYVQWVPPVCTVLISSVYVYVCIYSWYRLYLL